MQGGEEEQEESLYDILFAWKAGMLNLNEIDTHKKKDEKKSIGGNATIWKIALTTNKAVVKLTNHYLKRIILLVSTFYKENSFSILTFWPFHSNILSLGNH